MMRRILFVALGAIAMSVAACGGAVEQPVDDSATPTSTLKSANVDVTPWGVWNLVSLERG